jgi:hypothetical protein
VESACGRGVVGEDEINPCEFGGEGRGLGRNLAKQSSLEDRRHTGATCSREKRRSATLDTMEANAKETVFQTLLLCPCGTESSVHVCLPVGIRLDLADKTGQSTQEMAWPSASRNLPLQCSPVLPSAPTYYAVTTVSAHPEHRNTSYGLGLRGYYMTTHSPSCCFPILLRDMRSRCLGPFFPLLLRSSSLSLALGKSWAAEDDN